MDLEKQIETYVLGYKGGSRLERRLQEIVHTCDLIFKKKPVNIFVALTREGSGERFVFNDCWVFCEKSVVKATDFLKQNNLQWVSILKKVSQVRIETNNKNYDYFDEDSTLKLTVDTVLNSTLHMEAIGRNCEMLSLVIDKYILPNLIGW